MSLFSRILKRRLDDTIIYPKKPSDFKTGYVYKMSKGYHIKHPYYVEVIEIGKDFIITSIPELRTLKIKEGENWDYHVDRFQLIGNKKEHGKLLYNQKGLI